MQAEILILACINKHLVTASSHKEIIKELKQLPDNIKVEIIGTLRRNWTSILHQKRKEMVVKDCWLDNRLRIKGKYISLNFNKHMIILVVDTSGTTMTEKNKLWIENMVNTKDHKLFLREDIRADNHTELHKIIIITQLLGTVEAERQDAQTNLWDIPIQKVYFRVIRRISNRNWRILLLLKRVKLSILRRKPR